MTKRTQRGRNPTSVAMRSAEQSATTSSFGWMMCWVRHTRRASCTSKVRLLTAISVTTRGVNTFSTCRTSHSSSQEKTASTSGSSSPLPDRKTDVLPKVCHEMVSLGGWVGDGADGDVKRSEGKDTPFVSEVVIVLNAETSD